MTRILALAFFFSLLLHAGPIRAGDELDKAFANPPEEAHAWCYWWWLNGAASKEGITRDFEEMKRQGISGALLFDAGTAGPPAPRGPHFMSPEWRELFKHAVREADRCGITLTVNLCSGWNCGGAWRVSFDPKWGGPESVVFETLEDWTARPEPGIRHDCGTATYRLTINLPESLRGDNTGFYLDLGRVENLAM